ncbi:hypothetical protein AB0D49_27290 [Streptomyces sp. NPDC048290]|uniref:hypothetical protein n=1 Tax=Streptomyces sp. NPDC048290 TaxID=3155811 RepID=UPI00342B9D77
MASRPSDVKMTIEVYTVNRHGEVIRPPRATVVVPVGYEPPAHLLGTALPPCACPLHRAAR